MRPTSGLTFGGRYQLASRIAIGGMGEVWQATDLVIGRTVAIKILKDEYLGDPGFLERFRAEARHAALVNHEGIANVFDYGEEDGSAYLVMELVPGEALSTILERERVLPTDRVLDFVAQTASALQAAHAAGLVHRDIKPGNLLITPDGRVKITDFGIARIADQVPLTATGQVMGTVQYLSPEQASGHPASPSTDIYSLGIVAYEALAGRRPFTGESQVAIAMAQINEAPPALPGTVAEPVRNLVSACIAKKPEERPATAAHLARAAQALRRGDVAGAAAAVPAVLGASELATSAIGNEDATRMLPVTPGGPTQTGPVQATTKKRNPWTWPLIALIGILLVVLIGTIIALLGQPSDEAPPTSNTPSRTVATPSATTPSASPTSDSVNVNLDLVRGKTEAEARQILGELELGVSVNEGAVAPDPSQVGLVYAVDPTGTIAKGTTVTVSIYSPIPEPTKPGPPTGPGTAETGSTVQINWPVYTGCPPNTSLTAYEFSVQGGPSIPPAPVGTQSANVTMPNSPGTVTISYLARCGGVPSPSSDSLTITVAEPD